MILLVLALLQTPEPSIDERVAAFLRGDESARADLLKIGATAIRPLLQVRDRSPERTLALLREIKLKVAWPRAPELPEKFKNGKLVAHVNLGKSSDLNLLSRLFHEQGIPMFSDAVESAPPVPERVFLNGTSALEFMESYCAQTGLDYGFFHGTFVVGVPERLWPSGPVTKAPVFDEGARTRALKWIEELGHEAIDVRESAARHLTGLGTEVIPMLEASASKDLLAMGEAILPLLVKQLGQPEAEIAARCGALMRMLRPRPGGVFGPPTVLRQKLDEAGTARLRYLETAKISIRFERQPLDDAASYLAKNHSITFLIPADHGRKPVSAHMMDQSLLTVLSLVTQSLDLDFAYEGTRIVVDSREAIDKLIAKPK